MSREDNTAEERWSNLEKVVQVQLMFSQSRAQSDQGRVRVFTEPEASQHVGNQHQLLAPKLAGSPSGDTVLHRTSLRPLPTIPRGHRLWFYGRSLP